MTQTNQLIDLTSATIAKGQRAWNRIKGTAQEQRQLWKEVGDALLVGRRLHKADQKFSQWCTQMGFVFSEKPKTNANIRSDVMWLAQHWSEVPSDWEPTISFPTNLRQLLSEQQSSTPPIPDVGITESDTPRPRITIETAKKVSKLAAMAEGGEGQEKATAQKYLKKQAEKLGTDAETLSNLAKRVAQRLCNGCTPASPAANGRSDY